MADHRGSGASGAPIVVATDGSTESCRAVEWAAADAARHGCPLHVLASVAFQGAYGPVPYVTAAAVDQMADDGERVVDEAIRIADAVICSDAVRISREVSFDPIIPSLIARSRSARMLVVGSRGRGAFQRALLGSVSSAVVHHAHCPVAIVRTTSGNDPVAADKAVLVGTDGSANSAPAVVIAFDEAALRGVAVIALRCWSDSSGGDVPTDAWEQARDKEFTLLAESLAAHRERHPDVPVHSIVVRDRPARALLTHSVDAQLVVVGSHGRGGFVGMLLGSTSRAVVQSVECPIIVARQLVADQEGQ
ncbi:universal stress protein [Nocardia spumae]|uniref:universal stress protein n=1 Tax=Nocardia spumae TaxID=2887190 RepID=UPI001D15882F|nr:universal stress protein [Nocardia spumae]